MTRDLGSLLPIWDDIDAARIGGATWAEIARWVREQTGRDWSADELERIVTGGEAA